MNEPDWVPIADIEVLHGASGPRDRGALQTALDRIKDMYAYGEADLPTLAATLAFAIARERPFTSGNARAAWLAARAFLERNGQRLNVSESDAAGRVRALSSGEIEEPAFADWLRAHVVEP